LVHFEYFILCFIADVVPDAKIFLAQSLSKLSVANPGKVRPLTASLAPEAQAFLSKYLALANVQIS
jgi:hypothetical protein